MQATMALPMPAGSLEAYVQTVNRFPILTAEVTLNLSLPADAMAALKTSAAMRTG